jgi:hypothetical protein
MMNSWSGELEPFFNDLWMDLIERFTSHCTEETMTMRIRTLVLCVIGALVLHAGVHAQLKPKFEQPVLITSAGQSADVILAGMLCKRVKINARTVPLAKPSDLKGMKTMIVVAGFSSKGLGAAGISRDDEMERVKGILAAAKAENIPIVMMHLGGKPRRGAQSDDFNKIASEAANHMLVVKAGDDDEFFSKIAANKKIPIELVGKIAETAKPLGLLFK